MSILSYIKSRESQKGFTLIELLIVIAILGILTTAVLVSINPLEQFARGRDSGRLGAVDQLGHAIQSYYTSQDGTYLAPGTGWITALQTAGELKTIPVNPVTPGARYQGGCGDASIAEQGYCYTRDTENAIVFTTAESTGQSTKACGANANGSTAWIVWSSAAGKSGLLCLSNGQKPAIGVLDLK